MRRLGIIANDPIDLYLASGYSADWLKAYFNPTGYFDAVYSLAPYESEGAALVGLTAAPTPPEELSSRLRELQIDVVRAYGGAHPCAIATRAKVDGIPVIVSVHDALPEMLDRSIADADIVLCVSGAVKRLVERSFRDADRLWMLPNRVDFNEMRPATAAETADLQAAYPFKYRVVHVGRKVWEKNIEGLIRALPYLGPDYCLLTVGKGASADYERLAAAEGVADRCFFIDAIPNRQLGRYYWWADCCCMPSRTEAFCSVVIEALASGAMVVGSDIPATHELIVHGENGLLIRDYENPAAIAEMIAQACTDPLLRERARGNARHSVAQFERSRIDALEAQHYEKVLGMQAAGAFAMSLGARIRRSVGRRARQALSQPVKEAMKPFIGRT